MMATPIEDAAVRGGRNPTNPGGLRVTEPLAELPDNVCFTLTELTQRRLWADIPDFVEGPDEPEEG
jgi:hypothetical protein